MVSHKKLEIFNKVIKLIVTPYMSSTNSNLLDCRLCWRGDRYDLIFVLNRSRYNNERILLEAILETCNDLFSWVDISHEVMIVVEQMHNVKFFNYFELINEVLFKHRGYYSSSSNYIKLLPLNKEEDFYKWLFKKRKEEKEEKLIQMINEKPKNFFSGIFKF